MSQAAFIESPVLLPCQGEQMVGIVARPAGEHRSSNQDLGLVVIVGGPQYRAGSHRQFVHLARALAEAGDLIQPLAAGLIGEEAVRAELSALVRGQHAGRSAQDEITLFKSVGTAVADLGAASLVWRATLQG